MARKKMAHAQDSNTTTKPKKATSPFFRFMAERRSVIRNDNPDLKWKEISQLLGKEWKELSDEERNVYKQQYEEEKAELVKNPVLINKTRKKVTFAQESSDDEDGSTLSQEVKDLTGQVRNLTGQIECLMGVVNSLQAEILSIKDQQPENLKKTTAKELHQALDDAENAENEMMDNEQFVDIEKE